MHLADQHEKRSVPAPKDRALKSMRVNVNDRSYSSKAIALWVDLL